jgi:16S rRNA (guanine527-N7)-methyltransferase
LSERSPRPAQESWNELRVLVEREGGAPPDWDAVLDKFLQLLSKKNEAINLVSRASIDRIIELQVLPSMAGLLVIKPDQSLRVLDVGSGGGFPGIVLKILRPQVRIDLVEATQKKARFLSECIRALGLEDAIVHACRVESPTPELLERAPFEVSFARAVGQEDLVSRSVKPLLGSECSLWVFSGDTNASDSLAWRGMDGRWITGLQRLAIGSGVKSGS